MKFGKNLLAAAANQQHLPGSAYVDYKCLKKHLNECDANEFTIRLGEQIQGVRAEIASQLTQKRCCVLDIGPVSLSGSANMKTSGQYVDALYECIELNREACRKITKKFNKKHPDATMQQAEKLIMFDAIMKDVVDNVETWASKVQPTPLLSARTKSAGVTSLVLIIAASVLLVVLLQPPALQVAFGVGMIFAFLTAWGNAANDICNCVGTAVGCKALTLTQAVFGGIFFEVVGCVTLGPFVAKSITKGMIDTKAFEATPDLFAFCMVCVLIGAACSTLLATAYGFPISATHGIIGGLVASGLAAKGAECVGWGKLGMVAISWVVAPLGGALVAIAIYALIQVTVFRSNSPVQRARFMQPFFLWICIAVNFLFVFIKGPKVLRISPLWKALLASSAIGLGVVLLAYPLMEFSRRRKKSKEVAVPISSTESPKTAENETGKDAASIDLEASSGDEAAVNSQMEEGDRAVEEAMPEKSKQCSAFSRLSAKGIEALGLNEDITAEELSNEKRQFSFRSYESLPEKQASDSLEFKQAETYFVMLLVISAFSVCIAHGGNDVGNAIGPMSAILEIYTTGVVSKTPEIPLWATFYGALGFGIGILTMGRFTIKTVGTKITVLSPSKAFATQIGGAVAVLSASACGMPVSTSHCLVGAVFGIGIVQKLSGTGALNMKVLSRIFVVWIVTIPLAMLLVVLVFYPFRSFFE